MSLRYQFFQNPKTLIYETPAQAYMIIEGKTSPYKAAKYCRKRSGRSVICCHKCHCLSRSKSSKGKSKFENKQNFKRNVRLQSSNDSRKNENDKNDRQNYNSGKKNNLEAFSFRDLNMIQAKNQITCNYKKLIEQQNVSLRRQNKFLQQYIQTLQSKCKGSANKRQQHNRNSKRYETSRNSFSKKNAQNIRSSDTQQGSTFTNKNKGQNQWCSTYHN